MNLQEISPENTPMESVQGISIFLKSVTENLEQAIGAKERVFSWPFAPGWEESREPPHGAQAHKVGEIQGSGSEIPALPPAAALMNT